MSSARLRRTNAGTHAGVGPLKRTLRYTNACPCWSPLQGNQSGHRPATSGNDDFALPSAFDGLHQARQRDFRSQDVDDFHWVFPLSTDLVWPIRSSKSVNDVLGHRAADARLSRPGDSSPVGTPRVPVVVRSMDPETSRGRIAASAAECGLHSRSTFSVGARHLLDPLDHSN
jgi:hypothetical protein